MMIEERKKVYGEKKIKKEICDTWEKKYHSVKEGRGI